MLIEPTGKDCGYPIYKVTRKCPFSGKLNSMEMAMSYEDFMRWHMDGELIQNALPYLDADQREFLKTGITPEEWEDAFSNPATDSETGW